MIRRYGWAGKLIFTLVGIYGLAVGGLVLGWIDRDSEWVWVPGARVGGAAATLYLVGWHRSWFPGFRANAEREASRGRVYFPAGLIVASALIYLGGEAGGDISTFVFAFCGGSLGFPAVWL